MVSPSDEAIMCAVWLEKLRVWMRWFDGEICVLSCDVGTSYNMLRVVSSAGQLLAAEVVIAQAGEASTTQTQLPSRRWSLSLSGVRTSMT
jgi:hypothetical protein